MRPVEQERPTIGIRASSSASAEIIEQIGFGMEEEGVPHLVTRGESSDAAVLAHEAALASRLGVGVGLSTRQIVITTEKLDPARPYITLDVDAARTHVRDMGANAARLVKRMPLIVVTNE
ncbi:glycerol dehydratase reactivase beta/small subunit family protein [Propionibacterium australiense]|uniref:Dehydratase medium subunit n=1 Tax=Propionibacterium australiense TaxID=119981 RepID=A0A383S8L6_9ACTN|nr:glycerol dehydratase reactivase beta/small subunit family protein [Propionibacterium australiense]RLP10946.1 glycerol dehydratase reactivation factor [Propionibacterium australiense]RLP13087.1 glycerol dehydratase reactivation factor [Propionibacterium australiense]SYZ33902.1 Dehydratase medium subunit [Propionibacterium australiense]VEH90920.1 Dehydratase medium subunit [Propionibacterium australiense]